MRKNYNDMPNSYHNVIKSLRDDPNSSNAIGDLFQELTSKWRSTVSIIPVEDLNIKLNNHRTPIDHSWDSELGFTQTKGRLYNPKHRWWNFTNLEKEWDKLLDMKFA